MAPAIEMAHVGYRDVVESPVDRLHSGPDLLDTFLRLPSPGWISALLRLRDILVRPFGLKSGAAPRREVARVGDRVGPFTVIAIEPERFVLGEDDRHLDFRVETHTEARAGGSWVRLSTDVCFHGAFGRIYFFVVKPFHRRIAHALVRGLARELDRSDDRKRR